MGKIKIDTADISDIVRGGGGGRSVCEIKTDVVDSLKGILAERGNQPFALPTKKVEELFSYTGKSKKTSNVAWTINKNLDKNKAGIKLVSSHGGDRIGVEIVEAPPTGG